MLTVAPHPDEPERADAGFAIIETLVALAILAFALGVLLAVLSDGIRRQGRAEELTAAGLAAQSLLARVGSDVPLKAGVTTGRLPDGRGWLLRVERFGDAGDIKAWPAAAYRVVVEVASEKGGGNGALVELATLRLGTGERER